MGLMSPNIKLTVSSKKPVGLESRRQKAVAAQLLKGMKNGMSPARLASSLSTEDFKAAWENLVAFLESGDAKNTPENLGRLEEVEARSRFAFQALKNPVMIMPHPSFMHPRPPLPLLALYYQCY
jgi:Asp-tRNA(Asn)/Glu-tRNA(Gln) amidotransferase A subunit family amidase